MTNFSYILKTFRINPKFYCTEKIQRVKQNRSGKTPKDENASKPDKPFEKKIPLSTRKSHAVYVQKHFDENPSISAFRNILPEKYLQLKRITPPENIYLIDPKIAETVAAHILPKIINNQHQIVIETNAGLGLITKELLDNGIPLVRIYESCPDFKILLKERLENYLGRYELFTKDIFLLYRYDFMDKQDHGNRVEQLLSGVPKRQWEDDPVLTIIGTLSSSNFIRYLMKSLALQTFVTQFGRIQIYAFMKPKDYVVMTAGPHLNLHTYQSWSVLFNLLFDVELVEKFQRKMFLPWESKKSRQKNRYATTVDPDLMYFVRINFKKQLPVAQEHLVAFHAFVIQFFARGKNRVIPTLEKWFPCGGIDAIVPKFSHKDYFQNMNLYTRFGELTPNQILYIFEEMISNPEYQKSPFMAMVENQLLKSETIETSLDEQLEKNIVDDIAKIND